MFNRVWQWLCKLTKSSVAAADKTEKAAVFGRKYARKSALNLTAVAANKIANITVSDSDIRVIADSETAAVLRNDMAIAAAKMKLVATRALGVGGVVMRPRIYNGKMMVELFNQERVIVLDSVGDMITKAVFILCDANTGDTDELRVEIHELCGTTYTIKQRVVRNGALVAELPHGGNLPRSGTACTTELTELFKESHDGAGPDDITIDGVDSMLFGWVKCPVDDRGDGVSFYGVPITYGCEMLIAEIEEQLAMLQSEVIDKRAFIGADFRLFRSDGRGRESLMPGANVFKKFDAAGGVDDQPFFEVFSPEMRVASIVESVNFRLGLLEKAMGVNRGVLTDLLVTDGTATAIRRSMHDTFTLVDALRGEIEAGFRQLLYAMGMLRQAADGSKVFGDVSLAFDWSYGLIEDSSETFAQLAEGLKLGAVSAEELRAFLELADGVNIKS